MKIAGTPSIKKNLILLIMLISGVALLVAGSAFITYDLVSFRQAMVRNLYTLADVTAINSTAALLFDNATDATETLAALAAERHVTCAYIFRENSSEIFVQYARDPHGHHPELPRMLAEGHYFANGRLHVFKPVILDEAAIGTVYIQSDMKEFYQRLRRYLGIEAAVLFFALSAALLMTTRLQRIISTPILHLAQIAKQVSEKKDLSARAIKHSDDELGFLTEQFNEMLEQIQERDTALLKAQDTLENQAKQLQKELSERKRFEKALIKSEERFHDLFDNAPDIYAILDPHGVVTALNRRGLITLGYLDNEIVGKRLNCFLHPDDLNKVERALETIQRTGEPPKSIEARFLQKTGTIIWVSKEFSLLKNDDGQLQSIRVICRDITKSKQLQQELERAQRLEAAGRLAGQIAHDFNNLLGPLAAYPSLIRSDLGRNHPALELIDEIEAAANKIAEINQQLLALGRRGHYQMATIDLNDTVENVLTSVTFPPEIALRKELEDNLLLTKGGGAQLSRLLTNILVNAKEAIPGSGTITIKSCNVYLDEPLQGYKTIERGEYVKLEISDTGAGIQPEHLDKIFDPFFTTKTTDRMRGSGLGLSVVHGVVEDHKGYITVASELGAGATFSLYFPVTRDAELKIPESIVKIEGGDENILIVDDDPVQRRVTSQLLKHLGYNAYSVASGEEAIESVHEQPPDLIILDMVMEGIDGAETYERILKTHPHQRAIILSGFAKSKRVQKALRLGADGFVPKPISLQTLASMVRQALDRDVAVNISDDNHNARHS